MLTQVWLTAGIKNKSQAVTLQSTQKILRLQVPLGTVHLPHASGLWTTVTGETESPLAVEEEHSPGVGCMLRRATQAPTGEDNGLGEGERRGVGKEELDKRMIICYVNTGSGLQFVNGCVGALVSDRLHVREHCWFWPHGLTV